MSRAGFGTPKTNKPSNKTRKVEKGNNYVRALPQMHSLIEDPYGWRVYKVTIWGFNGTSSEPGKTRPRPVQSVEVKSKQGMVVQADPAIEWIDKHFQEAEAYKTLFIKKLTDAGKSEADAEKALDADADYKKMKDWLKAHNIEKRWYMNAFFKDGTCGAFKMNHRDHKTGIDALNGKLEKMDPPVKPLDLDEGVWYNIVRDGNGTQPPDRVELEYRNLTIEHDGKKLSVQELVKAPLTDEQINQALADCPDLSTLGGEVVTVEQMQALVDCVKNGADPEEIDTILDGKSVASTPEAKPEVEKRFAVAAVQSAHDDPAVKARLEAIKAKKEAEMAKLAAELKAKQEADKSDVKLAEPEDSQLSDDEFLKKFGS